MLRIELAEIIQFTNKAVLQSYEVNYLKEILKKYRPLEKAVFLASIVAQDKRREEIRWIASGVLGFVSGVIITNFEDIISLIRLSIQAIRK